MYTLPDINMSAAVRVNTRYVTTSPATSIDIPSSAEQYDGIISSRTLGFVVEPKVAKRPRLQQRTKERDTTDLVIAREKNVHVAFCSLSNNIMRIIYSIT